MKLIPVWDIVEEVLSETGRKPSPRLVLRVCEKVTKDINEDLARRQEREGDHGLDA